MKRQIQFTTLLSLSVLLSAPAIFAQVGPDAQAAAADASDAAQEEPEVSRSQEVEITEDNYRQFMELKDKNLQRGIIPEEAFKPESGLQKLDKLPEESQKHLRNELREIIVQGDPWQPGDEETEYPYTPSVAASTKPALEKEELEAWRELVDSYHERESQIYKNSYGMQTARGSEQGSSNSQQNGAGSGERQGQNGEGSEGQQAGQQGNPDQADAEGTYSLDGSTDSSANSTSGATQNAMEFLKGNTGQAEGLAERGTGQNGKSGGSDNASSESVQGQDSRLAESSESPVSNAQPDSSIPDSPNQPKEESTAGASQNALEYLTGEDPRAETGEDQPEGTLSIKDLLNAQGIGDSTNVAPLTTGSGDESQADEDKPEKDGGGP